MTLQSSGPWIFVNDDLHKKMWLRRKTEVSDELSVPPEKFGFDSQGPKGPRERFNAGN